MARSTRYLRPAAGDGVVALGRRKAEAVPQAVHLLLPIAVTRPVARDPVGQHGVERGERPPAPGGGHQVPQEVEPDQPAPQRVVDAFGQLTGREGARQIQHRPLGRGDGDEAVDGPVLRIEPALVGGDAGQANLGGSGQVDPGRVAVAVLEVPHRGGRGMGHGCTRAGGQRGREHRLLPGNGCAGEPVHVAAHRDEDARPFPTAHLAMAEALIAQLGAGDETVLAAGQAVNGRSHVMKYQRVV